MRYFLQTSMYKLSYYLELIISIILAVALIILSVLLINDVTNILSTSGYTETFFNDFLNRVMTLAVGVEFIKMLCKHSPSTVIEVLLFALARQIIVGHSSALDTLIGIVSLAILFIVRKYLFVQFDDTNNIIVRGSQKVNVANIIAKVNIPSQQSETLNDLMARELIEQNKAISIGACVYFNDIALRVDSVRDGKITRVEIIKSLH